MTEKIIGRTPSPLETFYSPQKTLARYDLDANTKIITLENTDHLLLHLTGIGSDSEYFMIRAASAERLADAILSILHGTNLADRAPTVSIEPVKRRDIPEPTELDVNRIAMVVIVGFGLLLLIVGLAFWHG